tara:strand:+ start:1088 stop:3193 length:2106 start_codon:yes stop_codon:yes gene_type:complete
MNKLIILIIASLFLLKDMIFANTENDTYINTNNITYDEKKNIVVLSENSKINIGTTNILIDQGIIDYNNDKVEILGNFYLYQNDNILSGVDLTGDTNLNNFNASKVSFIYIDKLKIDSKILKKKGDKILFYDNFLTPCKLNGFFNCPTWSIRVDETEYNLNKDQFKHYDSFLQIADYKVLYLPYFSHYGNKAPRQKGFLTPSIIWELDENIGFKIPYYYPLNQSSDLLFTPTFKINTNDAEIKEYEQSLILESKSSGGVTTMEVYNDYNWDNDNLFSKLKFNTKQVVNKNNVIEINSILTNSISSARSINEEPITFEEIYVKHKGYNIISKDDYLETNLSTVQAFDSIDEALVPIVPEINYFNTTNFRNINLLNEISFNLLKRNESNNLSSSELKKISSKNTFFLNKNLKSLNNYNKIILLNEFNEYKFNHDQSLNFNSFDSSSYLSSEFFIKLNSALKSRIKFSNYVELNSSTKMNENSNAITFNYENLFSENRMIGNDLKDDSGKISYGLESKVNLFDKSLNFKIGQTYDFRVLNNYLRAIKQNDNFSDLAFVINSKYNNFKLDVNGRLDNLNFSKKEMNYALNYNSSFNFNILYNETNKDAFENLSNDTERLTFNFSKELNTFSSLNLSSTHDLKNNYSPFEQSLTLNLFDECSNLELSYTQKKYNDNFNTQPEEKIGITFYMDYLGFYNLDSLGNLF